MIRKILGLVLLLGFTLPSLSQATPPATPSAIPVGATEAMSAANSNSTDGLELPADQTVKFDEGFVTIQAKCNGDVKWLVVSGVKIKYFTLPSNNTIIVSVPPQGGLITVFAVGLVNGKMTDFARTSITVQPNTIPGPGPNPNPNPNPPVAGARHVTFVVDLNNMTPALAQILNSQKVRETATTRNAVYRLYDPTDPLLKQKGLDKVVSQSGGAPLIIVQNSDGSVVGGAGKKMPATEAEVIQYLSQVLGGN